MNKQIPKQPAKICLKRKLQENFKMLENEILTGYKQKKKQMFGVKTFIGEFWGEKLWELRPK